MGDTTHGELSRIYETWHDRVVSYAAGLLGRDEAEDVAQEVFLKAGRALSSLEDPAKIGSWLYAITLNTVRDAARRRAAQREVAGSADTSRQQDDAPLLRVVDGGARTPEQEAIHSEMVACYLDYVRQLPPDSYEVYALREFEHLSNEEIARRLSLPLGTVKMRLHRARARLHEALRSNCRCYVNERGELMGEPKRR